jgi:AcrR family transcriptional regulator
MGRPPKITDEAILAAARQVFLDQGIGASTVDIAARAGISEASIFKRFSTKQALFLAAIGLTKPPDWVKALSTQVPTAAIKTELIAIVGAMLAFYQEVLPRVIMLMAPGCPPPSVQFPPPPVRDSQLLALFLQRAIDQGYLRNCNAATIAHMIVGAISNYVATRTLMNNLTTASPPVQSLEPSVFLHHLMETLWVSIAPDNVAPDNVAPDSNRSPH